MINITASEIAARADAYAQLEAEFKLAKERFEAAKDAIIALGVGEYQGELYTVEYTQSKPIETFDSKMAQERAREKGIPADVIKFIFDAKKVGARRNQISYSATAPSVSAFYLEAAE